MIEVLNALSLSYACTASSAQNLCIMGSIVIPGPAAAVVTRMGRDLRRHGQHGHHAGAPAGLGRAAGQAAR